METADLMHFEAVKCLICFDMRTPVLCWRGFFEVPDNKLSRVYTKTNFRIAIGIPAWLPVSETLIPPYNPLIQSQHETHGSEIENYSPMTFIIILLIIIVTIIIIYHCSIRKHTHTRLITKKKEKRTIQYKTLVETIYSL